jgi:type IV secretion system protein VirD4
LPDDIGRRQSGHHRPPAFSNSQHIHDAREFIHLVARTAYQNHDQMLAEAGAKLAAHANGSSELARKISALLNKGARWMDDADLKGSTLFSTRRSRRSLQIGGFGPKQIPLYFDGNQSLVTIAKPGKGKSLSQVVPNLFTYPGSCFVLDVKDELWAMTAAHREKTFGKAYRYAPTDETPLSSSRSRNAHGSGLFRRLWRFEGICKRPMQ